VFSYAGEDREGEAERVERNVNWQAGLFRLGLLAYAGWLLLISWQAYQNVVVPNRAADAAEDQEKARIEMCLAGRRDLGALVECGALADSPPSPGDVVEESTSSRPSYWPYAGLALAPLIAFLALWFVVDWVGHGFRSPHDE
jgi:hypothetical protein